MLILSVCLCVATCEMETFVGAISIKSKQEQLKSQAKLQFIELTFDPPKLLIIDKDSECNVMLQNYLMEDTSYIKRPELAFTSPSTSTATRQMQVNKVIHSVHHIKDIPKETVHLPSE